MIFIQQWSSSPFAWQSLVTELVKSVVGIRYISGEILLQAGGILLGDECQAMRCQSMVMPTKNEAAHDNMQRQLHKQGGIGI